MAIERNWLEDIEQFAGRQGFGEPAQLSLLEAWRQRAAWRRDERFAREPLVGAQSRVVANRLMNSEGNTQARGGLQPGSGRCGPETQFTTALAMR